MYGNIFDVRVFFLGTHLPRKCKCACIRAYIYLLWMEFETRRRLQRLVLLLWLSGIAINFIFR